MLCATFKEKSRLQLQKKELAVSRRPGVPWEVHSQQLAEEMCKQLCSPCWEKLRQQGDSSASYSLKPRVFVLILLGAENVLYCRNVIRAMPRHFLCLIYITIAILTQLGGVQEDLGPLRKPGPGRIDDLLKGHA